MTHKKLLEILEEQKTSVNDKFIQIFELLSQIDDEMDDTIVPMTKMRAKQLNLARGLVDVYRDQINKDFSLYIRGQKKKERKRQKQGKAQRDDVLATKIK